ncbi:MAG: two-component system, OmpR family, response regulator [Solirubrobacteraceae bacterium]|jgi:two-component system OmpR family response regulator|nr:two-component system, OmpR family, response regulator [Solirubrobacteraceae bacterium]
MKTSAMRTAEPMTTTARILVVDDEENITYLLSSALSHFGFEVDVVHSGREALEVARDTSPHLILLDVMMPDLDGFEVVRRLRENGVRVPVLFLTARDAVEDKVRGLTLGGDDYVTKPFSLEEIVARVQAMLRRAGMKITTAQLTFADVEMDDDAHLVSRGGTPIDLSPTEYKLLRFFLLNPGRVLSRAQILDHVWEYDFGGESGVVETYVSYLRRKLDTLGPPLLKTVRGVGYVLRQK